LPPSNSEPGKESERAATPGAGEARAASFAFTTLHPKIQQWIWEQGWNELRDAQERAAGPIGAGVSDVIIAAATASGKTEAAFLPICSAILNARERAGATRTRNHH